MRVGEYVSCRLRRAPAWQHGSVHKQTMRIDPGLLPSAFSARLGAGREVCQHNVEVVDAAAGRGAGCQSL